MVVSSVELIKIQLAGSVRRGPSVHRSSV